MSANIVKRVAPRRAPAKQKQGTQVNAGAPADPNGRFWTQRIPPRDAALISESLQRCYVVVKNHGPHNVRLFANHGDLMDLSPGHVRATYVNGVFRVENKGDEVVLIEFEIVPAIK